MRARSATAAPQRMGDAMTDKMGKRALYFADRGLAVFPLFTIDGERCSCGKLIWRKGGKPEALHLYCSSPGKHPIGDLVPHGVREATTDAQLIKEWWAVYPDANIGIATGTISGIVVLDIDPAHQGDRTLSRLMDRLGDLPPTWTVETGGGGNHVYFRHPSAEVRNSAGKLGPGLDVRGEGGYVVAPPSRHASGGRYSWYAERHIKDHDLADMPQWLLERVADSLHTVVSDAIPTRIAEGLRNTTLTSAAGAMRRKGFSAKAIQAALRVTNQESCVPPLPDDELWRIAKSVERYLPAATVTVGNRVA